jgi:hypothetical protein
LKYETTADILARAFTQRAASIFKVKEWAQQEEAKNK